MNRILTPEELKVRICKARGIEIKDNAADEEDIQELDFEQVTSNMMDAYEELSR